MSAIQQQSHFRADDPLQQLASDINSGIVNQGLEAGVGRYEPQAPLAHRVPSDPYTAWIEQREAAIAREARPRTRWVYRYPGSAGTKITR